MGRVVARLAAVPPGLLDEILVVDNRSADDTAGRARDALEQLEAGPRWSVVRNRENYSLGGSHKVAFDYAVEHGFTHVVVLHGDDQADITDFVAPLQAGLHRRYDSLLGARFMRGARLQGYSTYRRLGNYGLNFLCSLLTRSWIADQGSGLNLYSTEYLRSRFYGGFDDALTFPNQMFLYGIASGSRYRFLPISWREEDQVSNARAVRQALRALRLAARSRHLVRTAGPGTRQYRFDVVHSGGGRS